MKTKFKCTKILEHDIERAFYRIGKSFLLIADMPKSIEVIEIIKARKNKGVNTKNLIEDGEQVYTSGTKTYHPTLSQAFNYIYHCMIYRKLKMPKDIKDLGKLYTKALKRIEKHCEKLDKKFDKILKNES